MEPIDQYIFRSSEIFLTHNNTVPAEIPAKFRDSVIDSLDLVLAGRPARAVLLRETQPKSAVVSSSVSGPPHQADEDGVWMRLRAVLASDDPACRALVSPASRALGLLNWHHSTRFCSRCGTPLSAHPSELALRCESCSSVFFPRISPAIIVLVHKGNDVLLARHANRNQDVWACLAGFLEHGETLEECVAREVYEETGVRIRNVQYAGSQSWPYPDQHMVAFHAEWDSGEIRVDPAEISEARWFPWNDLPAHPQQGTVAWNLIHGIFPQQFKK